MKCRERYRNPTLCCKSCKETEKNDYDVIICCHDVSVRFLTDFFLKIFLTKTTCFRNNS